MDDPEVSIFPRLLYYISFVIKLSGYKSEKSTWQTASGTTFPSSSSPAALPTSVLSGGDYYRAPGFASYLVIGLFDFLGMETQDQRGKVQTRRSFSCYITEHHQSPA